LLRKTTRHFDTQKPAVEFAKDLAKKQETELVIHNKDGTISQKDSYRNDPCPTKGEN
jgi:hypothetical protein